MLCLIFVVALKTKLGDLCLTMRTFLPTDLWTLVTSDVNIFCREELAHLCEDVLEELHSLLSTYAKNVVCNTPHSPYFVWTASTSIFRICRQCSKHVAWEVDFWNYSYALCCSVLQDLLHFFLSIVAAFAVSYIVECIALEDMADDGLVSDRSHFSQTWVFLDLKSPALVICEMPVKCVELMDFHDVEILLDLVHCEEMTRDIKVKTAVAESRLVLDLNARKSPVFVRCRRVSKDFNRKHLLDGLDCIIEAVEAGSLYRNLVF